MLCPKCHRQVKRGSPSCRSCAAILGGPAEQSFDLILPDRTRIPLTDVVTIGRANSNAIHLIDPTVSRRHAVIGLEDGAPYIEDVGSSYGTYLDGRRVREKVRIEREANVELGDVQIKVQRRRAEWEEGRTIVVLPGASLLVSAAGSSELEQNVGEYGLKPRVRSGWALKRLDAEERDRRYVLRDLREDQFLQMSAEEAAYFELLDGTSSIPDLIAEAELRFGTDGPARLVRLLADLSEHGFLDGTQAGSAPTPARGVFARMTRPRVWSVSGGHRVFDKLYRNGGYWLFTAPFLVLAVTIAVLGLGGFLYLLISGRETPLLVAKSVAIGALIFVLGRLAIVVVHECAHGLTVSSFGRRVGNVGIKLFLLFPYAFVDTSEAWFETRRRRLAVASAGPAADLVSGGSFALVSTALGSRPLGAAFFQLALAAYVGGLYNLNPLMDRDGYQIMVDILRQPALRKRARERLSQRHASGRAQTRDSRIVVIYSGAMMAWSFVSLALVIFVSARFYGRLISLAPRWLVLGVMAGFYLLVLSPIALGLWRRLETPRRKGVSKGELVAD